MNKHRSLLHPRIISLVFLVGIMIAVILFSKPFTPSHAQTQGDLGDWTAISNLPDSPQGTQGPSAVVANGYLFILGGGNGLGQVATRNTVLSAKIQADGTLGTWSQTTPFSFQRNEFTSFFYNGRIYVIGGQSLDNAQASTLSTEYTTVNNDGIVSNWSATSSPLLPRAYFTASVYQNSIYIAGGLDQNGNPIGTIERSVIQPDGGLGPWQNAGTAPPNTAFPSMVITGGYLYMVGGELLGGSGIAAVSRAPIQNDGTVGAWISETPLTVGRAGTQPIVAGGNMYAIGGRIPTNGAQKVVERSVIDSDGSLGNWIRLTDLPTARRSAPTVTTNGFIYVVAGCNNNQCFSDILSAPILSNLPPLNQAPIAVAGTSLDTNGNLQLDGSLSSDPNNDTLSYTWQITGEASTRSGQTVSINDLAPGKYSVTLTVSDGQLQSVDKTTVGVVSRRPNPTVGMTIQNMTINKQTGVFQVNGIWDVTNPLFGTIITNPLSRLLFELQTGGTQTNPIYGVAGEDIQSLTTNGFLLR